MFEDRRDSISISFYITPKSFPLLSETNHIHAFREVKTVRLIGFPFVPSVIVKTST